MPDLLPKVLTFPKSLLPTKVARVLLFLLVPIQQFHSPKFETPQSNNLASAATTKTTAPGSPTWQASGKNEGNKPDPTQQWVLRLENGANISEIEEQTGASFIRHLRGLPGYTLFHFPETQKENAAIRTKNALGHIPGIQWFGQEILRPRFSRSHPEPPDFTDPLFATQWHLYSPHANPSTGETQIDLSLTGVWAEGNRGGGIRVAVVDDGLETTHPDLSPNFDANNSYDFIDNDTNPNPTFSTRFHGTAVAGLVAARDNWSYGVGIAPRASISGIRLIGGSIPDSLEAEALLHNKETIQIYNNSWGPSDVDSRVYEGPGPLFLEALQTAVQDGRGGLGNLYTWAAGNGGEHEDNSNYDGYANLPWTIAVAGLARDGSAPDFAEPGANILVSAPGENIVTTDLVGSRGDSRLDYSTSFGGSSAATAMVSGVLALLLETNPNIGWRDAQHILVQTARQNDPGDAGWQYNAAGFAVHHQFGFGLVDATAAVNLAKSWQNLPPANTRALQGSLGFTPGGHPLNTTLNNPGTGLVEHAQATLILENYDWGELNVSLTSPSGTQSILATPFSSGQGPESSNDLPSNQRRWTYMTVRNWGEPAAGDWTLSLRNQDPSHNGKVVSWELALHITSDPNGQIPVLPVKDETWNIHNFINTTPSINVLHNETLPEGGVPDWELHSINDPAHGTVSFTSVGLVHYEPNPGFTGQDIINYTVRNPSGHTGRGKLTIQVTEPSTGQIQPRVSTGQQPQDFQLSRTSSTYLLQAQPDEGHLSILPGNQLRFQPGASAHFETVLHTLRQDGGSIFTSESFPIVHSYDGKLARKLAGGADALQLLPAGHNISAPFTLEAWIYPTGYGPVTGRGYGRIFDKETFSLFLCSLSPDSGGVPYYQNQSIALWLEAGNDGVRFISTPENSLQLDTWQHVALHMDASGNIGIHLDGQPQELYVSSLSSPPSTPLANSQHPLFSGNSANGTRGFVGKVDNPRFWQTVRTTAQIANQRYFTQSGSEPGLAKYWPLDSSPPFPQPQTYSVPTYTGTQPTIPEIWQHHYFPGAFPIASDWWSSPTFGTIHTGNAPWLWIPGHQHLYLATPPSGNTPLWLYDPQLGWLWTGQDTYPWLWSNLHQSWLFYKRDTTNPRALYNHTTKSWTTDTDLHQQ